jgi:hypothetical protein
MRLRHKLLRALLIGSAMAGSAGTATVTGSGDVTFLTTNGQVLVPRGPGVVGARTNFASAVIGDIESGVLFADNHTLNFSQVIGIGQFQGAGEFYATAASITTRTLNMSSAVGSSTSIFDLSVGSSLLAQRASIGARNVAAFRLVDATASILGNLVFGDQASVLLDGGALTIGAAAPAFFPGMLGDATVSGLFTARDGSVVTLNPVNGSILRFVAPQSRTTRFETGSKLIAKGANPNGDPLQVTIDQGGDVFVDVSEWDVNTLLIGNASGGTLRVRTSKFAAETFVLGLEAGSSGQAHFLDSGTPQDQISFGNLIIGADGAGSVLIQNSQAAAESVRIGDGSGHGLLTINNSDLVAGETAVGGINSASAKLVLDAGGRLFSAAATVSTGAEVFIAPTAAWSFEKLAVGSGTGPKEAFVQNFGSLEGEVSVERGGVVRNDGVIAGELISNAGVATNFGQVTGGATVEREGVLLNDGEIELFCDIRGTYTGGGRCAEAEIFDGGVVEPGNSPGTFFSDGDVVFRSGSTLVMELFGLGAGEFDRVVADGQLKFEAGANLLVKFDGFVPPADFSVDLFDAAGFGVAPGVNISFSGLAPGYRVSSFTIGDVVDVRIRQAAVPEPRAWALLILGFGLAGATMRRRQHVVVRERLLLRTAFGYPGQRSRQSASPKLQVRELLAAD